MKKVMSIIVCLLAVLFLVSSAHATLELRGTDSQGYQLIYDSDLNITWYDYTNSQNIWQYQMDWASALSVSGGDLVGVYDDWRLPSTVDGPEVWGYDGSTSFGYNVTSSEMGYLFYTELGNKGYYALNGTVPQPGWGLANNGYFQNLIATGNWSGTEHAAIPATAWQFNLGSGEQEIQSKFSVHYAIAVRPGDVTVVPEPISATLFYIGAGVLAGRRCLKRKK